jgi:DNA-binding response OmpR family regulator
MQNVLLVHEDDALRARLMEILAPQGYAAAEARSCIEAQSAILGGGLDLIFADANINDGEGHTLLQWAKGTSQQTPFIVLSDASDVEAALRSYSRGADDILPPAFSASDVMFAASRLLAPKRPPQPAIASRPVLDPLFARISIANLGDLSRADLDLYIRLSEAKFVRIARRGGSLDRERADRYRKKGVESFFIRRTDLDSSPSGANLSAGGAVLFAASQA